MYQLHLLSLTCAVKTVAIWRPSLHIILMSLLSGLMVESNLVGTKGGSWRLDQTGGFVRKLCWMRLKVHLVQHPVSQLPLGVYQQDRKRPLSHYSPLQCLTLR